MESENDVTRTEPRQNNEPHSGERKHICSICLSNFRFKGNLKRHMLIHSGEKPFVCPTCSEQFAQKSNLNRHMLIHSVAKPHECPTCQKRFTRKGDLNVHEKIHSNERAHITFCNSCQKGFLHKKSLINHIRLHTGLKPYACDVCKKEFARKHDLISHLNVHYGQKTFGCSTCKKTFAHKSALTRHLKKHSNQQGENSLTKKSLSSKPKEVSQEYDELLKRFSCLRNVRVVCCKLTDDKIQLYSTKGYLVNVKTEIDDVLEQNKSDFCFEVPLMKEESNPNDEVADEPTPSTSYQRVKQEAEDEVEATSVNLCDYLFIKQEKDMS